MEQKIDFKKIINNFLPFALPLLIIFVCTIIGTFSKYYSEWQIENSKDITSDPGFFEGDCFESGTEIKSAEPVIFFGVRNYDSNNICDISDLNYEMKIMDGTTDVTDTLTISPTFTESARTLVGAAQSEDIIKISGFPDGIQNKNYKVVLSLNSPYDNYSFDATYKVTHLPDIASDELIFNKDTAPYMIRKIKTNDFVGTKPYTITWDASEEYPDPTDEVLKDLTAESGTGTINLQPNSCYELRFISELEWVTTAEEFNNIRNNLSGKYILGADIDLSGYDNWEPIGTESNSFTGTLDGNGFTISNVSSQSSGEGRRGLFRSTEDAIIQNLKVKNASFSGHDNVGILVGWAYHTTIYRCYTSGTVQADGGGIGGLVGAFKCSTVSESASGANVTNTSGGTTGGLVGSDDYDVTTSEHSEIVNCYSKGSVNGLNNIGGLIGRHFASGSVATSYSIGQVTGTNNVGGLVGYSGSGTTTNSYYNSTTSGQSDTGKGTPLNATQVQDSSNFVGFDFDNVWVMTASGPVLRAFVDEFVTRVSTPEEFNNIRNNLSGNYILEADIDLSGYDNWEPIGNNTNKFTGTLDGNGFTISNVSMCLFGYTDGATIQSLKVKDVTFMVAGNTGALIGRADNTTVYRCYTSGTIQASGYTVGGLIGVTYLSTISECASSINVSASESNVGGLIGCTDYQNTTSNHTIVLNCYSKGSVAGKNNVGGLVGERLGSTGSSIETSYSIGQVTGTGSDVGGLVGYSGSGTTTNCYYNSTTSGQSDTGKGTPLDSTQVRNASNFTGFDFDNVWTITDTGPVLKYFEDEFLPPAIITTAEQFDNIRNNLSGNYTLANDIDLSGYDNWQPIGDGTNKFTGTLDGNGYTVRNTTITSPSDPAQGLFGYSDGATIQNLKVKDAAISSGGNSGVLIGHATNTTVYRCYTSGTITSNGGLIGYAKICKISECASDVNISSSGNSCGGLVGFTDYEIGTSDNHTEIINCYSKGSVSANHSSGGFLGVNYGFSEVKTSYSIGSVVGSDYYIGGFLGRNSGTGTLTNCYYNSTTSGQSDTGKGTPLDSTQVRNASNFTGFDFDNVWTITDTGPVLKYFEDEFLPPANITTAEQFNNIRNNLSGNYTLANDIDLSRYDNWEPIGNETNKFTGTLDGNGFTVKNITIASPSGQHQGLFGYTDGATIQNLKVKDAVVSSDGNSGILIGWADNTTVYRCYTSGTIQGTSNGIGGLIGLSAVSRISECASSANVKTSGSTSSYGGLIGATDWAVSTNESTEILNCYSKGTVNGSRYVGGLVGIHHRFGSVTTSYSTGQVTGSNYVGGLIGGVESGTTVNSYYNSTTSGQSDTGKGTPLTAAQAKSSSNFVGFDFENIWIMLNDGPVLRAFVDEFQTS